MRQPITFSRQTLTIESIRQMRDAILLDPHYQRQGDVWPAGKQRLLIDSLLNGFLVPPMYWHSLGPSSEYFDGRNRYAVVDGRQRLETILAFLNGDLGLSPENGLLGDPSIELAGMTISTLRAEHPWLYADLMRAQLEVVIIDTDEVDLIEELFSRLNEGVPLKAAEKRNRGRVLAPKVRGLTDQHVFFQDRLPFGNKRYRHYDLLAKFMRLEDRSLDSGRVPDLKKIDLDRLFDRLRSLEPQGDQVAEAAVDEILTPVSERLDHLSLVFGSRDPFLGSVGMVTIYYVFDKVMQERGLTRLTRAEAESFERLRVDIKKKEEDDLTDDERRVAEFATYAQGPTSGTYLTARLRIMGQVLRSVDLREQPDEST